MRVLAQAGVVVCCVKRTSVVDVALSAGTSSSKCCAPVERKSCETDRESMEWILSTSLLAREVQGVADLLPVARTVLTGEISFFRIF